MAAVWYWGRALTEDPDRVGTVAAVGVDETKYLAANATERTRWISAVWDLDNRHVIDVIEGRQGPELSAWLDAQPEWWRKLVTVTVTDLHEPFRRSLATHLPNAVAVADPFHVVGVATRVVDRTRRRVQQDTHGRRGRKADPLYRSRKLLTIGAERLDADHRAPASLSCSRWETLTVKSTKPGLPKKSFATSTRCGATSPALHAGSTASSKAAETPPPPKFAEWPAPSPNGETRSWHGTTAATPTALSRASTR
ncbi:MAG: transposase [Microthrixaceae bacterium]|nr:transposase [Microthrixaceae bacterium]